MTVPEFFFEDYAGASENLKSREMQFFLANH
jgi:hypothetical protein